MAIWVLTLRAIFNINQSCVVYSGIRDRSVERVDKVVLPRKHAKQFMLKRTIIRRSAVEEVAKEVTSSLISRYILAQRRCLRRTKSM